MSRRQKEPLRALSNEERKALSQLSRSGRSPSGRVARATALLAVAEGQSYTAAAKQVGRCNGDTVALWVARFNHDGLTAVVPRHGGGPPIRYAAQQQRRILAEAERSPERARDGTATWSLSMLRRALRKAEDGLQGRRMISSSQQRQHVLIIPGSLLATRPHADLGCSAVTYEVDGDLAQESQVASGRPIPDAAVILTEGDIQDPMEPILYGPMPADCLDQSLGVIAAA